MPAKKLDMMSKKFKNNREKILYNCRKATLLIEKKQEVDLSSREKLELKLHLAGCYICRVYEQQSVLINNVLGKFLKGERHDVKLDDAFKEDLKKLIKEKMSHDV